MDALDYRISNPLFRGWRLLLIRGLAAIAFGLLTWGKPAISLTATGALTVLWLIAAYAVAFGIVLVLLAFKARSFGKQLANA
jgi:uncharacterized membrane protein HdeD (DUF308 family)